MSSLRVNVTELQEELAAAGFLSGRTEFNGMWDRVTDNGYAEYARRHNAGTRTYQPAYLTEIPGPIGAKLLARARGEAESAETDVSAHSLAGTDGTGNDAQNGTASASKTTLEPSAPVANTPPAPPAENSSAPAPAPAPVPPADDDSDDKDESKE